MNVALLVGRAGAIRVAVEQQPELVAVADDLGQRLVDVRPDRLGVHPAEERVALLVDLVDPDAAAAEQPGEPARAGAPHRLDEDVDVRRLERVEVDRSADVPLVALVRVVALDEARRLGVGEGPALDGRALGDRRLDDREHVRARRPSPVGALTLKPLSVQGLWLAVITTPAAAPRSTTSYELIWRRHGVRGVRDRDVVGQDHLGRGDREVLRGEPPVVGDDDALGLLASPDDVAGHAVGAAADVLECEVLGDPRPPAVGPEDDGRLRGGPVVAVTGDPPIRPRGPRAPPRAGRRARRPRGVPPGSAARISRGPALTASRPPMRSTTRSASVACDRLVRGDHASRSRAAERRDELRSTIPRSLHPTAIEAIATRRSLAAPSITARSIEIGLSRS